MFAMFAILEVLSALLFILASSAALASLKYEFMGLISLPFYFMLASLNFHQLINFMKVDVSGYYIALNRLIFFHMFSVLYFSVLLYGVRSNIVGFKSPPDALYLSISMWTTLGFETITPTSIARIYTSIEAIFGLLSIAIFTAMYWFYAQSAMEGASRRKDSEVQAPIHLQQNDVYGFMELVDADRVPVTLDAGNYSASACARCNGTNLLVRSHYRWENELVQLRRYIVCCESCNRVGPERLNAISAVRAWDRSNKQSGGSRDTRKKKKPPAEKRGPFRGFFWMKIGSENAELGADDKPTSS